MLIYRGAELFKEEDGENIWYGERKKREKWVFKKKEK